MHTSKPQVEKFVSTQLKGNKEETEAKTQMDGIFRDLVGERAFLDRVLVGVWGKARKAHGPSIAVIGNRGIAGPKSQYARLGFGKCRMSENPFQWAWGKYQKTVWRHLLPPFRFSMRSESVPITWAQLNNCVDGILLRGSRQRVTLAEVTFDTHLALDTAERDFFTSARTLKGRVGVAREADGIHRQSAISLATADVSEDTANCPVRIHIARACLTQVRRQSSPGSFVAAYSGLVALRALARIHTTDVSGNCDQQ